VLACYTKREATAERETRDELPKRGDCQKPCNTAVITARAIRKKMVVIWPVFFSSLAKPEGHLLYSYVHRLPDRS